MNREDFEIFKSDLIYFDNAATTMKPKVVVDSICDYYTKYTANAHRGDYDNSLKVDNEYEGTREKVKKFINANDVNEIIFTSGSTDSFNMVISGFMSNYLQKDDEVILDKGEHASNLLPWLVLSEKIGFKIKYAELDINNNLTVDNIVKEITPNTKVISIAHITNTIGDIRDVDAIGNICKDKNIIFMVDATQSIGHLKIDVQKMNVDFLGFSAHKMLGPTGVGVLYGKMSLLEKIPPLKYGGGMNADFSSDGSYTLKEIPTRFEAGTQNIAGVIGLGSAIDYLSNIGMDKIHEHEVELRKYLIEKLEKIDNIKIYNKNVNSGIVLFNVGNYFAQDVFKSI
jgi:cysteine desulfurase/selenocysteine lyase